VNKIFLMIVASFFSLTACSVTTHPKPVQDDSQPKMTTLEKQLQDKDQEIQTLQSQVDELNGQLKDQREQLAIQPQDRKKNESGVFNNPKEPQQLNTLPKEFIKVDVSPRDVQSALKNATYYDGPIDGKLGPKSQKAIMDFQMDHNLKSDGVVGKQTWLELKGYLDSTSQPVAAGTASDSSIPSQEY